MEIRSSNRIKTPKEFRDAGKKEDYEEEIEGAR